MRLLTTKIEGFGPHDLFEIDWTAQGDLVAIVAPNGAGKTFLIEADFACLYGDFPSYGGSLYDALTQNSTTPGVLTTTFEVGGKHYQAIRTVKKTAKTATQTAELRSNDDIVAGPKVRDFERAIETLLGPKHLALASWFSTQGTVGDLASLSAADRRDVFETVLDMGRLTEISESAKAAAVTLATEIAAQERTIKPDSEYTTQITALQEEQAKVKTQRQEKTRLVQLEADALSKMEIDLERLVALKDAHETTRQRAASLAEQQLATTSEINRFQAHLDDLHETSASLELLEAQALEINEAKACLETYQALDQWAATESTLALDVESKRELVEHFQQKCATTPEDELIVADLPKRIEALTEGRRTEEERADTISRLQGRIEELRTQLDPDVEQFHHDPVPAEVCHTCILHRNSRRMVDDLQKAELRLAETEEAPQTNLEALQASVDEATNLHRQFQQRPLQDLEAFQIKYNDASSLLTTHRLAKPEEPVCDRSEAERVLATESDVAATLQRARNAKELVGEYTNLLGTLQRKRERCTEELLEVQETVREYDDREYGYDLHLLQEEVRVSKNDLSRYRHEEIHKAGLEGSLAQQLKDLTAAQSNAIALTKALKKDRKRVERLKTIQQAFGKRGVQAVLIDQAVETLETHCNQFLQAVGGELQLAIVTQTETRDGRNKESLEILVTDTAGTRPVGRLSGGERRLISTVLRLGITLWASQLSGRACSTLRIDEAFDALDDTRSSEMITLLSELQDVFDQIVVITHNHNLATQFPSRITL